MVGKLLERRVNALLVREVNLHELLEVKESKIVGLADS